MDNGPFSLMIYIDLPINNGDFPVRCEMAATLTLENRWASGDFRVRIAPAERPGGCWQTRGILRRRRSATLPRGPEGIIWGRYPETPFPDTPPKKTHWWFGTFFIFPFHIWDNPSQTDELIFFKMVKTTNQMKLHMY